MEFKFSLTKKKVYSISILIMLVFLCLSTIYNILENMDNEDYKYNDDNITQAYNIGYEKATMDIINGISEKGKYDIPLTDGKEERTISLTFNNEK